MALELIGACEPLAAEGPATDEGPFPRVPAQVGPQVGRLAIDLPAAGDVTYVLLLFGRVGAERNRREKDNI